jgi:hypothetical protein
MRFIDILNLVQGDHAETIQNRSAGDAASHHLPGNQLMFEK